jgi:hypothetical protein
MMDIDAMFFERPAVPVASAEDDHLVANVRGSPDELIE